MILLNVTNAEGKIKDYTIFNEEKIVLLLNRNQSEPNHATVILELCLYSPGNTCLATRNLFCFPLSEQNLTSIF